MLDPNGEYVSYDDYAALQSKLDNCRKLLREAMEWNWLDDDMPQFMIDKCEAELSDEEGRGPDDALRRMEYVAEQMTKEAAHARQRLQDAETLLRQMRVPLDCGIGVQSRSALHDGVVTFLDMPRVELECDAESCEYPQCGCQPSTVSEEHGSE